MMWSILWHRPGSFALVLVAFSSINLTGTSTLATLTPGANGAGYPELGQVLYFHHGHLGSTGLVTDENANQISLVNYEPYGEVADSSEGQDIFRAKFTGKEFDNNSNLYYFGSRYYNAHLGRFMTPDPARQYFSPYIYGNSNPINGIDPNGELFITINLLFALLLVGGGYTGGAAVNHSMNPASWDWSSGKTWGSIFGAAAISGVAVGFGLYAAATIATAAEVATFIGVPTAYVTAAQVAATMVVAGGVMGTMGASFTAIGGGSGSEIASSFGLGFGIGSLFAVPYVGGVAGLVAGNYGFILDPSLENGIALGLDLIDLGMVGSFRLRKGGKSQKNRSCSSFSAGTEVLTSEGEKAIEDIEVGNIVWAYNEETGEDGLYPVSHLFTRISPEFVFINAGDEVIEATTEHEFYVDSKGWVKAKNLSLGDKLLQHSGDMVTVTSLESREEVVRVYNIEVEDSHTYYVAQEKVLVHNPKCSNLQRTQSTRGQSVIEADLSSPGNTGTATNQAVRTHVNSGIRAPKRVRTEIRYTSDNGNIKTRFIEVNNPKIPFVKWDAGHIIGRQNGGSGTNPDNIFPQNRAVNRWKIVGSVFTTGTNSGKNTNSGRSWRDFEDKIRGKINKYGAANIKQTTRLYYEL